MHAYMIVRIASIRTKRSKSRVQAEKEGERGKVGRRHLCTRSTSCYKVNVIAAVAARYSLLATKHGKPRALPGKLPAGDNAPFGGPPPDASRPPNPHPLPSTPHDRLEIPADVTIAARREEGTTHASGRGGEGGGGWNGRIRGKGGREEMGGLPSCCRAIHVTRSTPGPGSPNVVTLCPTTGLVHGNKQGAHGSQGNRRVVGQTVTPRA